MAQQNVTIHSKKNASSGSVHIQTWHAKQRTTRALKYLGITWGLAFASVFIPILHFVLVPCFLIAGPIVAYFIYQKESIVTGGKGTCSDCHSELIIVKSKNVWPLSEHCTKCRTQLTIEKDII